MQQSTVGDKRNNQQQTTPKIVMTGRMTSNNTGDVAGGNGHDGNGCGGAPM